MTIPSRTAAEQARAIAQALGAHLHLNDRPHSPFQPALEHFQEVFDHLEKGEETSTHAAWNAAQALSYCVHHYGGDENGPGDINAGLLELVEAIAGGPLKPALVDTRLEDNLIAEAIRRKAYDIIPVLFELGIRLEDNKTHHQLIASHIGMGGWPHPDLIAPYMVRSPYLQSLMGGAMNGILSDLPIQDITHSLGKFFDLIEDDYEKIAATKMVTLGIEEWMGTMGNAYRLIGKPEPAVELFALLFQKEHLEIHAVGNLLGGRSFSEQFMALVTEGERMNLERNTAEASPLKAGKAMRL